MYKIVYAPIIDEEIYNIYSYISQDSEIRALRFIKELQHSILSLAEFPESGTFCEFSQMKIIRIRKLIYKKYIIFYRVNEDKQVIEILHILNGAQKYKHLF